MEAAAPMAESASNSDSRCMIPPNAITTVSSTPTEIIMSLPIVAYLVTNKSSANIPTTADKHAVATANFSGEIMDNRPIAAANIPIVTVSAIIDPLQSLAYFVTAINPINKSSIPANAATALAKGPPSM